MKPHVVCLMASSVDGRTLHSRWRPKGSGADLFERVHDELAGDAWLVGRVTGQEFAKGKPYPASTKETFPRAPWFARRDAKAYGLWLMASCSTPTAKSAGAARRSVVIRSSSSCPRQFPATGGRRRCQRCFSARRIGRRAQFDPLSGCRRGKGCTERLRFPGRGGRSPRPRHGDDAGEQSGPGRRRAVAAVPGPE